VFKKESPDSFLRLSTCCWPWQADGVARAQLLSQCAIDAAENYGSESMRCEAKPDGDDQNPEGTYESLEKIRP